MKISVIILLLCSVLLGGCLHFVNEESPKSILIEATPQATCPACPTCEAPSTVTHTPTPTTTTVPPTSTPTPVPPTSTPTPVPPTSTPITPTSTNSSVTYLYKLQASNPVYSQNFNHPAEDCNWIGVSGQVFNKSSLPLINLVIHIWGTIGQNSIDSVALTGHPDGIAYGPGGYEIVISNSLIASTNTLSIQLLDLNAKPLSAVYKFSTFANCTQNLILINFTPIQ